MQELQDYSGEFDADIKYENFSKEVLLKMLELYARLVLLTDGLWNTEVKRRHGPGEAFDIEDIVWLKMDPFQRREIMKILDIQGNDVATFMKINQWIATAYHTLFPCRMELKNKNHGVITVLDCPALKHFERQGDEEGMRTACHEKEPLVWGKMAQLVNPDIKTKALKLPPREGPEEIACQFEFTLEDKLSKKSGKR